jgi:hypothetical protein
MGAKRLSMDVYVWDDVCRIVPQKSKNVWVAVGDYNGNRIQAVGATALVANKHWAAAARYRGK